MPDALKKHSGSQIKTCKQCETRLLPQSVFCHHCGRRVHVAEGGTHSKKVEPDAVVVKLHGLYDANRREELALALIPVLAGISRRIDMSNVEHIDLPALLSLLPLMEAQLNESAPPIEVIGMNDDVFRSLARVEFEKFFICI